MASITPPTSGPIKLAVGKIDKFVPIFVEYQNEKKPVKLLEEKPIQAAIQDSLKQFESLKDKDPANYAFKHSITKQYINEKNRAELLYINKQTCYHQVILCLNIQTDVKEKIDKLINYKSNQIVHLIELLKKLKENLSNDKNYAFEFYGEKGKSALVKFITDWKDSTDPHQWELLHCIYENLIIFIEKCNISWDSKEVDFSIIKLIIDTLNNSVKENKQTIISDDLILLFLNTLNNIINNSEKMRLFCLTDIKYSEIIFIIKRQNISIRQSLLILLNNSFKIGDLNLKMKLFDIMSQQTVKVLFRELIRDFKIDHEIVKNLAILKKNILIIRSNQVKQELEDKAAIQLHLKSICDNAFQMSVNDTLYSYEEKYTRLGFNNPDNILADFDNSVASLFAVEFMKYFSQTPTFKSILQSFIIDKNQKSSEYTFPFGKASIALVKQLYELLELESEKPPSEKFELIFIIFYQNDGLNEFLSKALCLFNKLWNEMKAQTLDFDRALLVCKESLLKILNEKNKLEKDFPSKINDFITSMETWKYDNIKTLNLTEKLNKEPVKQLKQLLTNEIIEMIKPKRIHLLCKGQTFDMRIQPKEKEKRVKHKQSFWKLSSDLKEFIYHDSDNFDNGSSRSGSGTLQLENIKEVKKEDAKKDKQSNSIHLLCDTIDRQSEETYILGNQNEETIDSWIDAINMILNPKTTANIACFVECLTDTQLLDIQTLGVIIPQDIPKVPTLPDNFDFNTKITFNNA